MGRPTKNTIDYFPHFTTNGKTLFTLESQYGNDGYAFWFKLLEILGNTSGHYFCYENKADWLFLVAKTNVSEDRATDILQTLCDLEAIDKDLHDEKVIWSENFVEGLRPVYSKRGTETPLKPSSCDGNTEVPVVPVTETRQSKVKESKGKKSKGEKESATALCPHQKIISSYNSLLGSKLTRVKTELWNGVRKTDLTARWKESEERQSCDWWMNLFDRIGRSSFLTGDNDRGWAADMGWILKQGNMTKILEGKYDDKSKKGGLANFQG